MRNGPRGDDATRDTTGEPLFAVARDHVGELFHVVAVHDVGRGQRLLGVHSHVERRVESVRETALGTVELRAAHSEIHQDAHHARSLAVAVDQLGELLETAFHHLRPLPEGSETRTSGNVRRRRHGRCRADAGRADASSTAEEWPAPPTVQSTISPSGTGRKSSTTSRTITGRCENSASTSVSLNRFAGTAPAAGPVSSPPVDRRRPGWSPRVGNG